MMLDRFLGVIISGALIASGIFMGCSQKGKESMPPISEFIADSVYMPISQSDHFKLRVKEVGGMPDKDEIVMFVKSSNFKAYFYDMSTGKYVGDSFALAEYENEYNDSYPLGLDSLMIGLEQEVVAISKSGIKKWDISGITRQISPYAFAGYLAMESLHVFGDTIAFVTSTTEDSKTIGPSAPFLKANHDVLIKLLPDTAILLAMHNPNPPYLYKQDYYGHTERVYINSKEIVYNYIHSDTIIGFNLFSQQEKSTKIRTENFTPNAPFDYARAFDFKYIDSFCMAQSRMTHLFYDRERRYIYSILHHKGKSIEDSGKKNDAEDLPYSLFVLDEQLNQLEEIYIPAGAFGPMSKAFMTHKGLYIPAANSKQKYHDKTLFYRIVIP